MELAFDPGTGETHVIPGISPIHNVNAKYYYNKSTGKSGYYDENTLAADPQTAALRNRAGHELEPAFTPQEIAHERKTHQRPRRIMHQDPITVFRDIPKRVPHRFRTGHSSAHHAYAIQSPAP